MYNEKTTGSSTAAFVIGALAGGLAVLTGLMVPLFLGLFLAFGPQSSQPVPIPLPANYIMNPAWNYGAGPRPVTAHNSTAGLEARYEGFTAEGRIFRTKLDDARAARFAAASANLARDVRSEGYELGLGYAWTNGFIRAKYADAFKVRLAAA